MILFFSCQFLYKVEIVSSLKNPIPVTCTYMRLVGFAETLNFILGVFKIFFNIFSPDFARSHDNILKL